MCFWPPNMLSPLPPPIQDLLACKNVTCPEWGGAGFTLQCADARHELSGTLVGTPNRTNTVDVLNKSGF